MVRTPMRGLTAHVVHCSSTPPHCRLDGSLYPLHQSSNSRSRYCEWAAPRPILFASVFGTASIGEKPEMVNANAARRADDPVTLEIIWGKLQAAGRRNGPDAGSLQHVAGHLRGPRFRLRRLRRQGAARCPDQRYHRVYRHLPGAREGGDWQVWGQDAAPATFTWSTTPTAGARISPTSASSNRFSWTVSCSHSALPSRTGQRSAAASPARFRPRQQRSSTRACAFRDSASIARASGRTICST